MLRKLSNRPTVAAPSQPRAKRQRCSRCECRKDRHGLHFLHRATDDERSERTRSVPSVASRRVAAPYGVTVWTIWRWGGRFQPLKISARYARKSPP